MSPRSRSPRCQVAWLFAALAGVMLSGCSRPQPWAEEFPTLAAKSAPGIRHGHAYLLVWHKDVPAVEKELEASAKFTSLFSAVIGGGVIYTSEKFVVSQHMGFDDEVAGFQVRDLTTGKWWP